MTSNSDSLEIQPQPQRRSSPWPFVPFLLLLLALGDLRVEFLLLFDHFTLTSLAEGLRSHPLAVAVLLAQPSLWRRYRSPRRRLAAGVPS